MKIQKSKHIVLCLTLFAWVLGYGCGPQESDFFEFTEGLGKGDTILSKFNPNWLMYDSMFTAVDAMSQQDVQAFLESTPYGNRCFLADEMIGEQSAAEVLHAAAVTYRVNPILLLVRLQVEKSLISKSIHPGEATLRYALGCGAYDDTIWLKGVEGLKKQIGCAVKTLAQNFINSQDLVTLWQPGVLRTTEDKHAIIPANDATAALYAYTPWVYGENRKGGNWLAWSVTSKFIDHLKELNRWHYEDPGWIGTPCTADDQGACDFQYRRDEASCLPIADEQGICSIGCRGICPDHANVQTFCVKINSKGACVPKASISNNFCMDLPHTLPMHEFRFQGSDSVILAQELVCMPEESR